MLSVICYYKYKVMEMFQQITLFSTDYNNLNTYTVEPPFNGQFGDFYFVICYFVLYTEVSFTRRFYSSGTGNANLRLYKTQNCFREDVLRNLQM